MRSVLVGVCNVRRLSGITVILMSGIRVQGTFPSFIIVGIYMKKVSFLSSFHFQGYHSLNHDALIHTLASIILALTRSIEFMEALSSTQSYLHCSPSILMSCDPRSTHIGLSAQRRRKRERKKKPVRGKQTSSNIDACV